MTHPAAQFPVTRTYKPPRVHVLDKQVEHWRYHEVCQTVDGHVFQVYVSAPLLGDRGSGSAEVHHWWDGKWRLCHRLFDGQNATPEQEGYEGDVHANIFEADRNRLLTVAAEIVGAKP